MPNTPKIRMARLDDICSKVKLIVFEVAFIEYSGVYWCDFAFIYAGQGQVGRVGGCLHRVIVGRQKHTYDMQNSVSAFAAPVIV